MTDENGTAIIHQYKTLEAGFDRSAKVYDATFGSIKEGSSGNALLGWLREQHLALLRELFPSGASLIDIGCATGELALALAGDGYAVLAVDISPAMVRQAQTKAAVYGLTRQATFRQVAAGRLVTLDERGPFQGAYAGLGTLNMEPDLAGCVQGLHTLLEKNARVVVAVMGRHCLYEILHNLLRLKPRQTRRRSPEWSEGWTGLGGVNVPVRFFSPDALAAAFAPVFVPESVMALPLWLPPLYMSEIYTAHPDRFRRSKAWDRRMRSWRGFRAWGDHFVMVLRHVDAPPVPVHDQTE